MSDTFDCPSPLLEKGPDAPLVIMGPWSMSLVSPSVGTRTLVGQKPLVTNEIDRLTAAGGRNPSDRSTRAAEAAQSPFASKDIVRCRTFV
jgi:hypothetical protein